MAISTWSDMLDPADRDAYRGEHGLIEKFLSAAPASGRFELKQVRACRSVLDGDAENQRRFVLALFAALQACREAACDRDFELLCGAAKTLLRRNLPFDAADVQRFVAQLSALRPCSVDVMPIAGVLAAAERILGGAALSAEMGSSLNALGDALREDASGPKKTVGALIERINRLCDDSILNRLQSDEGWVDSVQAAMDGMSDPQRQAWETLFAHVSRIIPASPAKDWSVSHQLVQNESPADPDAWQEIYNRKLLARQPDSNWRETAERLVESLGRDEFAVQVGRWLSDVPKSRPGLLSRESLNRETLRGLIWSCIGCDDAGLAQTLRIAGEFLYKKNSPLGNAVVQVLYRMPGEAPLTEMTLFRSRARYESQKNLIGMALRNRAVEVGISPDEVEELAVPTLGLTEVGRRQEALGQCSAELAVTGAGQVELRWFRSDGRQQKSVPAKAAAECPDAVSDLKSAAKQLRATLAMIAARLEASWLNQRSWDFTAWRERYLKHPVAGIQGCRLIWTFSMNGEPVAGIWHDGQLVDLGGEPLDPKANATVKLWHPLDAPAEQVLAWREWLLEREITQPFKQAHREVYLLTDAERGTRTYSNRFAAHILRQTQFRVLAKSRGWSSNYCGPWDTGVSGCAERDLPGWGLQAGFWFDGVGDDFTHAGGYEYVATDQVRFYTTNDIALQESGRQQVPRNQNVDAGDPIPLEGVPPLVFSEIMRDVDLFVGVASVGNDPNWSDGGPEGRFRDYWQGYSFGELSATAQTRKAVLERLVPRLKIADRCSFSERFLVVKGELREYKIHLGSGNILMSPNDRYLCIVPKRGANSAGEKLFLPFEGDPTLSIILSKALLLADDRKITDPTIVSQIK
jgi:hypothetical protein